MNFSSQQKKIAHQALSMKIFLHGYSDSGKSTAGKAFLAELLNNNIPGNRILLLVSQRSLGVTYQEYLDSVEFFNGNLPSIQTVSGLSQKIIRLFWPIIGQQFGFADIKQPPIFLNIESSQYFMAKVCQPFFDKDYFSTIKSEKPRILSQILDNLNKAAVIGIPYQNINEKLKAAWNKDLKHLVAYDEAQECAHAFREYCLKHNLIDFSLSMEIFFKSIQQSFLIKQYLFNSFDYCLYDNCEEDTPLAHDLVIEWLPQFKGALVIFDEHAGYRSFLGADPNSALRIKKHCSDSIELNEPLNTPSEIQKLIPIYQKAIHRHSISDLPKNILSPLSFKHHKFYPDMLEEIVNQISSLIEGGTSPNQIAILSPFVSNSMRFQLQQRLDTRNIKLISHRPSRSLEEESITHGLFTWIKLAYPELKLPVSLYQFRTAIHHVIGNMDPIRADLLSRIVLAKNNPLTLRSNDNINPATLERISIQASYQYKYIYEWLMNYQNEKSEVDVFLARFFGEVISQPGFGFHKNFEAAEITGKLIESMKNFRSNTLVHFQSTKDNWALDYLTMLENGLISALYIQNWELPPEDSVYLAPAHTFLMQNRTIQFQFWLDIGNLGWWQRLMQPLTQPYVLSRNWPDGMKWTDIQEYENNQLNMEKMITGLLRRCSGRIFLYTAGYNENGDEQAGPLLKATQKLLRIYHHQFGRHNV